MRCGVRLEFDAIVDHDFGHGHRRGRFPGQRHSRQPAVWRGDAQLGPPNQERQRQAADGRLHPRQQSRDAHPPGPLRVTGDVLVPFPDVTPNDGGAIDTTVTSSQPSAAGLAAGTFLNIHLAPAAQLGPGSLGYTPISCAGITPAASTTVTMTPPPQPGQHPQGSATLTYDPAKQTLTVAATASGLVAGSDHAVHIHLGSCDSQGAVKYPLNDLVASPTGAAATTTVIQNVDQAPPASGWYINVHLGSSNQIEQNGKPALYFQPIICGNIGK
jgi:CHRD domain